MVGTLDLLSLGSPQKRLRGKDSTANCLRVDSRKYQEESKEAQFSHSVVSDSLWPHGLQHARHPCPSPTTRTYSNSCPSSQWCHLTISSSVAPFSCLQSFPALGSVFSNGLALYIRWQKYWSFSLSFSPSTEYLGLISFRIDWFDLLAVQGTLKSLLQPHNSKASSVF